MSGAPAREHDHGRALRLFFALWPDTEVRRALVRASRRWVRAAGGRAVPVEKLHITLAFLGSVPAEALDGLKGAAACVAASSFELVLDRVGFFPGPRTLWLGPSQVCAALTGLERSLWAVLEPRGWKSEARPFQPHVTLARKAQPPARGPLVKPVVWPVEHFSLVESRTERQGAVYQELARWPLGER